MEFFRFGVGHGTRKQLQQRPISRIFMPEKDARYHGVRLAAVEFAEHRDKFGRGHAGEALHFDLFMVDQVERLAADIDNRNRVQLNDFLTLLEPAGLAHSHQELADFQGLPAKPPGHCLGPVLKLLFRRHEAD